MPNHSSTPAPAINAEEIRQLSPEDFVRRLQVAEPHTVRQLTDAYLFAPDPADGRTPLHIAAAGGWLRAASFLLQTGSDVNAREHRLWSTPLMEAASRGQTQLVKLLLSEGADPTLTQRNGSTTALMCATYNNHVGAFEAILNAPSADRRDRGPALLVAADRGYVDMVRLMLEKRQIAPDSPRFANGNTALMTAASHGHLDVLQLLLQAGASTTKTNPAGRSVFGCAAESNRMDVLTYLAKAVPSQIEQAKLELTGAGFTEAAAALGAASMAANHQGPGLAQASAAKAPTR